jgi:hypothetical protein
MEKLTLEWLRKKDACTEGIEWFEKQEDKNPISILKKLSKYKYDWSNWLVVELLRKEGKIKYAINAAELVLNIFEKKYPNDERPREAIKAAKKMIKNKKNKSAAAAYAAAYAAYAAADANINTKQKIINYGLKLLEEKND